MHMSQVANQLALLKSITMDSMPREETADMDFLWFLPDCSVHDFHTLCPIQWYLRRRPSRIISSQQGNEQPRVHVLWRRAGLHFFTHQ